MMLWLVGGTADERNGAIEALETAGHVAETTDPMDTYADMSTAVFVTIDHLTAKREDGTLEFDGVATLPGWASDPLALAHVAVLSGCLGKPVLPVGVWITPTEGEADGKDD